MSFTIPSRPSDRSFRRAGLSWALLSGIAGLLIASPADAQTRRYFSSDPSVTVDLSVLGDSSGAPITTTPLPDQESPEEALEIVVTPSGLLFPPASPPRSRLVGPYASLPINEPATQRKN